MLADCAGGMKHSPAPSTQLQWHKCSATGIIHKVTVKGHKHVGRQLAMTSTAPRHSSVPSITLFCVYNKNINCTFQDTLNISVSFPAILIHNFIFIGLYNIHVFSTATTKIQIPNLVKTKYQ
jgi:hypothetical protein